MRSFGGHGTGPGQFSDPSGIAAAPDGNSVYVTDDAPAGGTDRVQRFSLTGVLLDAWGISGTGPGEFDSVGGVAVEADGDVWVADGGANDRLTRFSASGDYEATMQAPY